MTLNIRYVDPCAEDDIALIARRMRETLIEVLGEQRGREMYSIEWLQERVRWHLDASCVDGAVFVAEDETGVLGHTIVRVESELPGAPVGLFSTTYVVPQARRKGVAGKLLREGELWMSRRRLDKAVSFTDVNNLPLQTLYCRHGYTIYPEEGDFVRLEKALSIS